jgi:hypothetical protein
MVYLCRVLSFLLFVFLVGCSNDDDIYKSRIEKVLGIEIKEEYTVLEKSSDSAVGDYTETFLIQFNEPDFNRIISRLNMRQLETSLDKKFLYLNDRNLKGDKLAIVISLKNQTIKYTLADI